MYAENSADLKKSAAALAAAENTIQTAKGIQISAIVEELVHLRAEVRRYQLSEKDANEIQEGDDGKILESGKERRSSFGKSPPGGLRDDSGNASIELVQEMQETLDELLDRSNQAEDGMEQLLALQEESELREKTLESERDALQRELEVLRGTVAALEADVAKMIAVTPEPDSGARVRVAEDEEIQCALLAKEKERGDELSRQNSQIVHKLQDALRKKKEAEISAEKAIAEVCESQNLQGDGFH